MPQFGHRVQRVHDIGEVDERLKTIDGGRRLAPETKIGPEEAGSDPYRTVNEKTLREWRATNSSRAKSAYAHALKASPITRGNE